MGTKIRIVETEIRDAVQRGISSTSTNDRAYWRATEASLRKEKESLRKKEESLRRKEESLRRNEEELRSLRIKRREKEDERRRNEYASMSRQGLIGKDRLEWFDFYKVGLRAF